VNVLLQILVSGLLAGGVYALIAMGLTLIFGVMRIINFAHGDFIMVAMYVAFGLNVTWHLDPYVSILILIPMFFVIGVALYRAVLHPLVSRGAPHSSQALATLGVSILLVNGALIVASGQSRVIDTSYSASSIQIGSIAVSISRLMAFGTAVVASALLFALLRYTTVGLAIRAAAQDRRAAELVGIPTDRIQALAFGLGTACTGIAGAILIPFFYVNPSIGLDLGLVAYVVVVLGGLGSMTGAFVGGLIIGVVEQATGYFISPSLSQVTYLLLFVAILLLRPQGLFGLRGSEALS